LRKCAPFFSFLLLVLSVSSVPAGEVITLYQPGIISSDAISITDSPEAQFKVTPGEAPSPYPPVYTWEHGYMEQLGKSGEKGVQMDGIHFSGQHWMPGNRGIVLWKIIVEDAASRRPFEFEDDLVVSLWVDWNKNGSWGKNEKMIHQTFNLKKYFPTDEDHLEIHYITWFEVPEETGSLQILRRPDDKYKMDEVTYWVRGVLAYDDEDVSPDGEMCFGEAEDYKVTSKSKTGDMPWNDG
jgi:hypothetical protein